MRRSRWAGGMIVGALPLLLVGTLNIRGGYALAGEGAAGAARVGEVACAWGCLVGSSGIPSAEGEVTVDPTPTLQEWSAPDPALPAQDDPTPTATPPAPEKSPALQLLDDLDAYGCH